ncbi:MAG: helix-turn-helix transcriptional regulator [Planctomycetota bacterium]
MLVTHAFHIGRLQCAPGTELGPRTTVPYEFVRILKGNVRWEASRPGRPAEAHDLGPGAFILSHPGTVERYRWDKDSVTQHDFVHFYLGDLPHHYPPTHEWISTQHISLRNILNHQFENILSLNRSGHPQAKRMVRQAVEQMLDAWVHDLHSFAEQPSENFPPPVKRALDLVRTRWEDKVYRPPSIDELVEESRVSRSAFLDAFKRSCGASPGAFFEHQRVHLARLQLLETNRTIDEVASLLGYPNPFQLSRNFKHVFQLSPRHYREAEPMDRPPPRFETDGFAFQAVFEMLSMAHVI